MGTLPWTKEEDAELTLMWGAEMTPEEIEANMHRSVQALVTRAYRIGLSKKTTEKGITHTLRKCMTCDADFYSEGIHNRRCFTCKAEDNWEFSHV